MRSCASDLACPPRRAKRARAGAAPEPPLSPSLTRYVLREMLKPFGFFILVFTGVIWLTQSLQVIDQVVETGQGAAVFLEFSALLLPFVMSIVLPIAAFGATLYAVNKLFSESEIVAMLASGMSMLALARPAAIFGAGVTAALFAVTLWLTPTAAQTLRDRLQELRGDIANALIFEGRFVHPSEGLTIYVRDNLASGEMRGVFVHDRRDPRAETTYAARRAVLGREEGGLRMVMFEGVAQRSETGAALSVLRFETLVFDLEQFMRDAAQRTPRPRERNVLELIAPTAEQLGGYSLGRFYAEGHEHLSGPLYALALPLVAVAALLSAGFSRRGYAARIFLAVGVGVALRLTGLAMRSATAAEPSLWPTMYAPPILGAAAALAILAHGGVRWRARRPAAAGAGGAA
ncbi:MAG: LPS export ABC transporter permease LptF [Rubrimonas sp.]